MSNRFGIPEKYEKEIRARDLRCVYCKTKFKVYPKGTKGTPNDMATIEHFKETKPFYWDRKTRPFDPVKDLLVVGICCGKCNKSRGNKNLVDWFLKSYCRENDINDKIVAEVVKKYLINQKILT